jgi:hypothetical protein
MWIKGIFSTHEDRGKGVSMEAQKIRGPERDPLKLIPGSITISGQRQPGIHYKITN